MEENKTIENEELKNEQAPVAETPTEQEPVTEAPVAEIEEIPVAEVEVSASEEAVTSEESAETVAEVEEPAAETEVPAEEQEKPAAEEEKIAADLEEPSAEVEEPVADAEEPAAEVEKPTDETEPQKEEEPIIPHTKEEVVERLKQIVVRGGQVARQELEHLKQIYYHFRSSEVAAAREAFVADGGTAEDFVAEADPVEEAFKAEMSLIRELRAKEAAQVEEEKQANLKRKLEIIELVKTYGESPETADKKFDALKKLQAEWKELKLVPAENATELWKNYQLYIERFYDQLHLNHEARMYDFKKNLEKKIQLCEAAERLADVEDPVSAFHQLQKLHQEFRETGPVENEKREEIWMRFKAASTAVNKRHQEHFETLKAQEEENLARKTSLCEQVEGFDTENCKSVSAWDAATKKVLEWQAEWKTIGFAPRKMNTKIFDRFRSACDAFFQRKSEFFKEMRESFSANLEVKNSLVEQAEALKDSTDWNSTANKFVALQKKWKETGPVAHKVSDAIWKRFNDACNYFFEKKNEATGAQRQEEAANMEQKNQVIADLEAVLENPGDDPQQKVHDLQDKWNSIGHVPFRKKDQIYKKYRAVLDRIYEELHISARRRSVEQFRRSVAEKVGNELSRERQRLQNAFEAKKDEIKNYETNLSFFSAKSKNGNSLVAEIEKKLARLREELETISEKLRIAREQERAEDETQEED